MLGVRRIRSLALRRLLTVALLLSFGGCSAHGLRGRLAPVELVGMLLLLWLEEILRLHHPRIREGLALSCLSLRRRQFAVRCHFFTLRLFMIIY